MYPVTPAGHPELFSCPNKPQPPATTFCSIIQSQKESVLPSTSWNCFNSLTRFPVSSPFSTTETHIWSQLAITYHKRGATENLIQCVFLAVFRHKYSPATPNHAPSAMNFPHALINEVSTVPSFCTLSPWKTYPSKLN